MSGMSQFTISVSCFHVKALDTTVTSTVLEIQKCTNETFTYPYKNDPQFQYALNLFCIVNKSAMLLAGSFTTNYMQQIDLMIVPC